MLGSPSLRRPHGLMAPRGPGVLGILLVLTLGAIFYWGGAREPDAPATPEPPPPVTTDAG